MSQVYSWRESFNEPFWPSSVLLSCGLIYLYFHLAGGVQKRREPWMILAIVTTVLLGAFTTPGLLVAIGLIIIGYAFEDYLLSALAYIFLIYFLIIFYYALNIDLAHKSWIIAGSGILLLYVRRIASQFEPKEVFT
jgi:uncharacterized membrane protein